MERKVKEDFMLIVGFTAITSVLNIALANNSNILDNYILRDHKKNLAILIPQIKKLLQKNKLKIQHINLFTTIRGPGSFTGIRISLATLKGLVTITHSKVITFDTFSVLRYKIKENMFCFVRAGRNKFFVQGYKNKKIINLKNKTYTLEDFCKNFSAEKNFWVLGELLKEEKLYLKKNFSTLKFWEIDYPQATNLCQLAYKNYKKYEDINKLKPIYYLLSQPEIKLKEKQKNERSTRKQTK